MESRLEPGQDTWSHIAELFELRENLIKDCSQNNSYLQAVKREEVESNIYAALAPYVRSIVRAVAQDRVPEDMQGEIINDAVYKLFGAYSRFAGKARLKTFFGKIVKNFTLDSIRKICAQRNLVIDTAADLTEAADKLVIKASQEGKAPEETLDGLLDFADRVFEMIKFEEQALTDSEFVAVVMKFACALMGEKISDGELARRLGWKRMTFVDTFKRGRNKILGYWKEKLNNEK